MEMRQSQVEQFLEREGYAFHYDDALPVKLVAVDDNPARWLREVNPDVVESMWITLEYGGRLPAIVVAMTSTSKFALLSGRHRIEAYKFCDDLVSLPAYVIDVVLSEAELEGLPYDLNNLEGRSPDEHEKIAQAALRLKRFPDLDIEEVARRLGTKSRKIRHYIKMQDATERATRLGVIAELEKIRDEKVRVRLNGVKSDKLYCGLVKLLAFTRAGGSGAQAIITDAVDARGGESDALDQIDLLWKEHEEELDRRRRAGKRPVKTRAAIWRENIKRANNCYPESIEQMQIASLTREGVRDLMDYATEGERQCKEVMARCEMVLKQWAKVHTAAA